MDAQRRQYGNGSPQDIDWGRITNVGLMGGLLGCTFATMIYNQDERSKSFFFWGLILGFLASALFMYVYLLIQQLQAQKSDKYAEEMAERKRALRRKEMEVLERHDEFVYYDAAAQHSFCFKFLFCPHYGKITSERILYSEQTVYPVWESSCCCSFVPSLKYLKAVLAWPWAKKVQSMDIDSVIDVGVEQSCMGYVTSSGTVVLDVKASDDPSTIIAQREKIVAAIKRRDHQQLLEALDGTAGVKDLAAEVAEARALADELADAAGTPMGTWAASKGNSLTKLHVLSVIRPYAVLDDLSYKITKNNGVPGR
jgi:hypothetical protein